MSSVCITPGCDRPALRAGVRCPACSAQWRKLRRRADLGVPPTGALPPPGQLVADDDGERVQCHACGRFVAKLGMHARHAHGLDPDAYRDTYDLNRTASLAAPALRARLRAAQSAHLAAVRPEEPGFTKLTRGELSAITSQPRRLQHRRDHAQRERERNERQPRPVKPKPTPLPLAERIARANAARAAKLADPEQRAAWKAAISAGRRKGNLSSPSG